jgi:hypothetical protein
MASLVALFLIAHGLVHVAIYAAPPDPSKGAPFDPSRSWLLADRGVDAGAMRATSIALALATAAGFGVTGALLLLDGPWAGPAVVASLSGLTLKSMWFHLWLTLGVAIDLAVATAALAGLP